MIVITGLLSIMRINSGRIISIMWIYAGWIMVGGMMRIEGGLGVWNGIIKIGRNE